MAFSFPIAKSKQASYPGVAVPTLKIFNIVFRMQMHADEISVVR